jgi:hypothetical protein
MRQYWSIRLMAKVITGAASLSWGKAISGLWVWPMSARAWGVNLAAGITLGVIAALCWYASAHRCADADRSALIRTLSRTVPLRRAP